MVFFSVLFRQELNVLCSIFGKIRHQSVLVVLVSASVLILREADISAHPECCISLGIMLNHARCIEIFVIEIDHTAVDPLLEIIFTRF